MADFSYLLGLASDQFPLFSVPAYTQLPYCIQTCVDAAVGDAATSSSCFDNGGAPATCLCSAASPIHERMSSVAEVQCPNVQGGASSGADAFSKYCLVNGAVVKGEEVFHTGTRLRVHWRRAAADELIVAY